MTVGGPHGEAVLPFRERPVVPPDHPGQLRQWLPQLSFLPLPAVHLHLHLRDAPVPRVGYSPDGDVHPPAADVDGVRGDRVDDRGGPHARRPIPAAQHPVAADELGDQADARYPLGLLHAIEIRDEQPQWVAMLLGDRFSVPRVGQHDAGVGLDHRDLHHFVEAVRRRDMSVVSTRQGLCLSEDVAERDAGPEGGADERAPHRVGDA